jgi:hypothetical protein
LLSTITIARNCAPKTRMRKIITIVMFFLQVPCMHYCTWQFYNNVTTKMQMRQGALSLSFSNWEANLFLTTVRRL